MGNGVPCLTVWMDGNIPLLKVSAFDNQLTIDQVIDQITKGSCERFRNVFSLFQQKERTICFSSSEFKVPQFYNVLNGLCLCLAKVFPLDPFLCNACSLERSLQLVLSWLQRKRRGQEYLNGHQIIAEQSQPPPPCSAQKAKQNQKHVYISCSFSL